MNRLMKDYIEKMPGGGWRVAGSRVSLDSIVHAYWEGRMPEAIAADFPSLSLEQIHGAIAFYLSQRQEVDSYLSSRSKRWDALRTASEAGHAGLLRRVRARAGKGQDDAT